MIIHCLIILNSPQSIRLDNQVISSTLLVRQLGKLVVHGDAVCLHHVALPNLVPGLPCLVPGLGTLHVLVLVIVLGWHISFDIPTQL